MVECVNTQLDWMEEDDNLDHDFNSLKRKHIVDGFRTGISSGQEYVLQSAFNAGYSISAEYFEKLSTLRGRLSALLMYLTNVSGCKVEVCKSIETFISTLEELENQRGHIDALKCSLETSIYDTNDVTGVLNNQYGNQERRFEIDDDAVDVLTESMAMTSTSIDNAEEIQGMCGNSTMNSIDSEIDEQDKNGYLSRNSSGTQEDMITTTSTNFSFSVHEETRPLPSVNNTHVDDKLEKFLNQQSISMKTSANMLLKNVLRDCDNEVVRNKLQEILSTFLLN